MDNSYECMMITAVSVGAVHSVFQMTGFCGLMAALGVYRLQLYSCRLSELAIVAVFLQQRQ